MQLVQRRVGGKCSQPHHRAVGSPSHSSHCLKPLCVFRGWKCSLDEQPRERPILCLSLGFLLGKGGRVSPGVGTNYLSSVNPSAAPTAGMGDEQGCLEASRSSGWRRDSMTSVLLGFTGTEFVFFFFFLHLDIAEPPVLLVVTVLHWTATNCLFKLHSQGIAASLLFPHKVSSVPH